MSPLVSNTIVRCCLCGAEVDKNKPGTVIGLKHPDHKTDGEYCLLALTCPEHYDTVLHDSTFNILFKEKDHGKIITQVLDSLANRRMPANGPSGD